MRIRSVFVVLLALKTTVALLDPTIRLYLGDSAAYLAGALDLGWLPSDRSFTYSLLLAALVRPTGSLWTLLVWQSIAGAGVALLLWVTLVRRLAVSPGLALAAACLLALEPAQLYLERMVLAETFGLLAFAGFFAAGGAYLASRRPAWLPAIAALGLLAASLRLNYLPVVLVVSIGVPWLRAAAGGRGLPWRVLATHGVVALCSVVVMHSGYRYAVAIGFDAKPGYLARAGFMQLGLVTPLLTDEHLERAGLPSGFGERLRYPLAERRARLAHMWSPGGLADQLREGHFDVEEVSRDLFRMAVADDPLGLPRLGLQTAADYFRADSIQHALDNDLGRREIPDDLLRTLRDRWRYDADGLPSRRTLISRYYEHAIWWLVACLILLVPLSVSHVAVGWRTPRAPQVLLAALIGIGLVLSHVLFVNVPFYRYLQPLPFFVLANIVPMVDAARRRRRLENSSAPAGPRPVARPLHPVPPGGTS
jgi:hypothetical protein